MPHYRTDSRNGWTALAAAQSAGFRALFVITTNLLWRRDGTAVMGKGLALSAAQRYPGLDARYGEHLRAGRHVVLDGDLVLFPSKRDWRENACLDLIAESARALVALMQANPQIDFVLVPHVGANNGRLNWLRQVRPLLEREFAPIARRVIFVA